MSETYPLFLRLRGKRVLVVGAGKVATGKLAALREAGADLVVVAPEVAPSILELAEAGELTLHIRRVDGRDLDDAWFVVAAATPSVNRVVRAWAEARKTFVLAVDDVAATDAFSPAVFARGGVRVALSSEGRAPALVGLLREALEQALPDDERLATWMTIAVEQRAAWKRDGILHAERRQKLLARLLDARTATDTAAAAATDTAAVTATATATATATETDTAAATATAAAAAAATAAAAAAATATATATDTAAGTAAAAIAPGTVVLVGAGPGAADLLTMRAVRALAAADIVFYDALVCEELLALAPRAAACFVGKRAGRPSMSQDTITRLLIRAARRGQRVVRLKAGDPFVFGRGGEEALALARAGIRYEVIPGVSSALAAPAAAGIPVTHRGLASGMVLLTGEPEDTWRRVVADLAPRSVTVVMLMGLRKRAALAEALLARGWPGETPIAVVFAATSSAEARVFATLGELATVAFPAESAGQPGVIVIGDVVGVAHELTSLAADLEGVA